ncbi:hypothetical protein E8L99_12830 [Phreatobacter aquaticus]|uniref:Sulfatase N-terminal domain-containing protein n=1 Tax=Phreatobacter aquaticus TaxID=2570229 RepID=A0A4D7QH23_9HYPH|nr:sulfatase-like hydrolase/transferase [Phreatobacter aquaticus]QCK86578.1 hypothetical protein E8L99_12830 [Phreatobacter aquaticus]
MAYSVALVLFAGIAWFERDRWHLAFSAAGIMLAAAFLSLVTDDLQRAMLLAVIAASVIGLVSHAKFTHSGFKLTAADVPLLFAGTVPFIIQQYPVMAATLLTATAAALVAIGLTIAHVGGDPASLSARLGVLVLALGCSVLAFRLGGGRAAFRRTVATGNCFVSSFLASLVELRLTPGARGLSMIDVAASPLPLAPARPPLGDIRPDILMIQHESVFDPRLYGLPVDQQVADFLAPSGSLHGGLNVDIFGGGSWQSEFSVMTGLSSASFGADAYFLFRKGQGRFRHTLPLTLDALGYRTALLSSCRRGFLDYEAFYRSIGMAERIFSDDLAPPFDLARFEVTNADGPFLDAVADVMARGIAEDAAPRFLYALTNFNHGPHTRSLALSDVARDARAFALRALPDPQYGEYYARLAETAAAWAKARSELLARLGDRPMLVVHYGDHQPVLTRRIEKGLGLAADPRRTFRTFYAIERLNMAPVAPVAQGGELDIAFLGTRALIEAGLPLDPVFATRAGLMAECGSGYFAAQSERKRRFHRTLVETGAITLG